MKKNDIEIIYRVHEGLVGTVKGTFSGILSLDEGYAMLIVKTVEKKYHYVPLIAVVHLTSNDLFTNIPETFEDRACA